MIRVETMKFHPLANRARVETAETAMPEKVPFHAAFLKAVDMFPRTDRSRRTGEKWISSDEYGLTCFREQRYALTSKWTCLAMLRQLPF